MAGKLSFLRIIAEDFPSEYKQLVDKLAYPINLGFETLSQTLDHGLDFNNNINSQVKDITLKVNGSGVPSPSVSFKSTLSGRCSGMQVIRATNQTNPGTFPTSQPFVSFTESQGQIQILNVTGLQSGQSYVLRLIAYG